MIEETFDIKPDVASNSYTFIEDTWPALALVKSEPTVELDPCQALIEDDDSFEESFSAGIAGVRIVFRSFGGLRRDPDQKPGSRDNASTTRTTQGVEESQTRPGGGPRGAARINNAAKIRGGPQ